MKRINLMSFAFLALVLMACDKDGNLICNHDNASGISTDSFQVLHESNGGHLGGDERISKTIKVLKNQCDYEAEWARYRNEHVKKPPVDINFDQNQVLLLDMGTQGSTSYYAIEVTAVEDGEESVVVNVVSTVPTANCVIDEATSRPYQFVLIAGTKPLTIREEQIERCDFSG